MLVFLALALIGLTSEEEHTVRGAYLVMAPAAWFVLVPLAHASLLSGIALSLGTAWGLLRHYWVVFKLLITMFSTAVLLMYMGTFQQMAGVAADPIVDVEAVRNASPLVHATLALALLLTTTVLGVYKPFGRTPFGVPRETAPDGTPLARQKGGPRTTVRARVYLGAALVLALVFILVMLHIAGRISGH